MVRNGRLAVHASNDLAGDPAYQVVKELRVDYVLDGKPQSAAVREGQMLYVPDEFRTPPPPAPRLTLDGKQLGLIAAKAGKYKLTTASGRKSRPSSTLCPSRSK